MNDVAKPVTGPFEKTKGWLDWYEGPSKPGFSLPPGASTRIAMCSDPAPSSLTRPSANTPLATPARRNYSRSRDHLGFARNVIVQATCHGADNSAMVDACLRAEARRAESRRCAT